MTPVECCGQGWSTNFCPTCGKELRCNPLLGLLKYVQGQCKQQRGYVDNERKRGNDGGYLKKREEALAKWESWRDALIGVVKEFDNAKSS